MKKLFAYLLTLLPFFVNGQLKEDIFNTIIKINKLESEDRGVGGIIDTSRLSPDRKKELYGVPNKYDNYLNFQGLLKLITHSELIELTKHQNGVVRMFSVRQLIKERDYEFDFFNFFLHEFNKKDSITIHDGCEVWLEMTYGILLGDCSGNWNYARSTNAKNDLKFLDNILRPIDSFILFKDFDFKDWEYENIFYRQKFPKSANHRIVELIRNKFNFWAFNYLKTNEPMLYASMITETVNAFEKHKKILLTEHQNFFEGFLRYLVTSQQYKTAKSFLQELADRNYSKESIDFMLMGIDKTLIDKVR